jgi:hypothetical protein
MILCHAPQFDNISLGFENMVLGGNSGRVEKTREESVAPQE